MRKYSCYETTTIEASQLPQVILIQTDSKLNVLRLFTLFEHRLKQALAEHKIVWTVYVEQQVKQFIHNCLKSLVVYDCHSREQFLLALAALESYMQSILAAPTCQPLQKSNITPIFIDSVNSNFELMDRFVKIIT